MNPATYAARWARKYPILDEMKKKYTLPSASKFLVTKEAVLHIRCSDAPFVKHAGYTLLPQGYFKFVADQLMSKSIRTVHLLMCSHHRKHPLADSKCPEFASTIRNWLLDRGMSHVSHAMCLSEAATIAAMCSAKALVSTGGTFSFIAGVLKPVGGFISPLLGAHINITDCFIRDMAARVHWTMWPGRPIPHSAIEDYATFNYSKPMVFEGTKTSANHVSAIKTEL